MNLNKIKEFLPTSWAVNNRTAVYVFTVLLSLIGYNIFQSLPKEQFPDIVIPTISVATIYPGATPEDIENIVTKPIEKQLKSISGIKKITSNSLQDVSIIVAEFNTSIDVAKAKQEVTDAVDKSKSDLPNDLLTDPQVKEFNFSEVPIMNINVSGDFPLDRLKKYAEDLQDKIETYPEITRVDIIGGLEREVKIDVDMFKMQNAGLTFSDIERSVKYENINIGGGDMVVDNVRRSIRVNGEFANTHEIEDIQLKSFLGNIVYLRDIAVVSDSYKEKQDFARLNGKNVITLNVIKKAGANLLEASHKIKETLDEYKNTRFPEGLDVVLTGDTSIKTEIQVNDLMNTVIIGFVLVIFILMFFMGLQSAFFVALAVPLSSIIAVLFMPSLGFTFNVIVIFSFLLALGIIVDDAIVVIENTHRIYHETDWDIVKSAKAAAGEVFVPVLAGTLTTIAPFFPLLLWPGVVGKFMRYLPITLILTLFASLFVAFIINPVFAATFMKRDKHDAKFNWKDLIIPSSIFIVTGFIGYVTNHIGITNFSLLMLALTFVYFIALKPAIFAWQNKIWPKFINGYQKIVAATIKGKRPVLVVLTTVLMLAASFIIFSGSNPQVQFFPQGEPNFAYVYCQLPSGTDAKVTDSVMLILERKVSEVIGPNNPNVESVITNVGIGAGDPQNPDRVATPHKGKITVAFVEFGKRKNFSTLQCLTKIREKVTNVIPAAEVKAEQEASGPPVGKEINVEITGDDFGVLQDLEQKVRKLVLDNKVEGFSELTSDLQKNKPEITIEINKEKALAQGISKAQAGMEIRTALFGKEVSKLRDKDEEIPIMLRFNELYRGDINSLMNLNISFMDMSIGQFREVPLSAIANVHYTSAFSAINRKNQRRVINLGANALTGYNANAIVTKIGSLIKTMDVPEGYTVKMTGAQDDQKETSDFLGGAFGGAIALMFLILVFQFNSVVKPIIIFSTVIFSFIGIFLGFAFSNLNFSIVMTGVGIFSLSGIVIRNGIILVEFIDELLHRGLSINEAIVKATATRITPVLLTASATMLGLVPLAIGLNMDFGKLFSELNPEFYLGGDNVSFWGPLAWTMIFGLSIATVLTLLVVPSMYIAYYKIRNRKKQQNIVLEPLSEDISHANEPIETETKAQEEK